MEDNRPSMDFDIVIVGAGPAGLSAAIRLKQLCKQNSHDLSICILEKGAEVGAHILSGAVLEPRALNELLPDWQALGAPLETPVTSDRFLYLSRRRAWRLPTPPQMQNEGNYIIRLSYLCRWMANVAQDMGVEIYPGFAAAQTIIENGEVKGVITNDVGIDKEGKPGNNYQPGMALRAKLTLFAEGCRGSLTEQLIKQFELRKNKQPQTYGIGIKELWQVDSPDYQTGSVVHTIGWPLDQQTYGGSFLYHLPENTVALGFVVGLDYHNPYLDPFKELQRFKTHPAIKTLFHGGQRIAYGARALNEGGWQSIPKLDFPGGLLIGDCAGFLNVPKIKGTHTAMKSAMCAAEACFEHLVNKKELDYQARLEASWLWQELYRVRNIRPGFRKGLWSGMANAAIDTYVLRGRAPWTLNHDVDHKSLKQAKQCRKIDYPKPDNQLTFDRLSSVYLTNTYHEENQPCHLQLTQPELAIKINYQEYASPESRYCPAGVYEVVFDEAKKPRLRINAQNCIHCKTCDIKDPKQNITWVAPEGGGGPNYSGM